MAFIRKAFGFGFLALIFALIGPAHFAVASTVYSQSNIGTPIELGTSNPATTNYYGYYFGGATLGNPPTNVGYWTSTSVINKMRVKRVSGVSCVVISNSALILDSDLNLIGGGGFSFHGTSFGDYCDMTTLADIPIGTKIGEVALVGPNVGATSMVLDGSPLNDGISINSNNDAQTQGGFAFQLCDNRECDQTFEPPAVPGCVVDCYSSVLFLPGLEASRLYKPGSIINSEDQLWEPNFFGEVSGLLLDTNGNSLSQGIFTKDVIDRTVAFNVYKSLISNLDNLVTENKIKKWKAFAYDWRQGIDDLVQNGTRYPNSQIFTLMNTLQTLVSDSKSGKVTIIAHSNGGLLAKALIKKLEDMKASGENNLLDNIDNLVLVASPQLGTPDGLSAILHGYKQSIPLKLMTEEQARKLANNMPSAYGLVPSQKYFEQPGIVSTGLFDTTASSVYKTFYGADINTYQEEHNFIMGQEGRPQPVESDLVSPIKGNSMLLAQAESLHNSIDNMTFPSSMNVVYVAGWGKSTIAGMKYTASDIQPVFTIRGDQTVVMPSALYGAGTKYWLDLSDSKIKHSNIFEDPQLLDFLENIIEQKDPTSSGLKNSEPTQVGNRIHLSVHSPVSIGAYDSQGNFTGKVCDSVTGSCVVQEDIPGSSYFDFGEGKYVNLGQDNIQKVELQGTDVGTFTFDSDLIRPNGQVTESSFVDIPVTTQTQGEVTLNGSGVPQLKLDVTGDGITDIILNPKADFDPILYLQIMKATIDSLDLQKSQIKTFDSRVDNIIKSIQKGKTEKAKLKADKFKNVLEKKLSKPDSKHPRPKKLSKTDAQLLLDMLNKLLDNLG